MKKIMIFAVFFAVAILFLRSANAIVELSGDERLSFMGPFTGPYNDEDYDAVTPSIVYNPVADEYLVVWASDDEKPGPSNPPKQVDDEFEIFARRLDSKGEQTGNQFIVSKMGVPGDADNDANGPEIAVDTNLNRYLVTWVGDDTTDDDNEAYGRLFAADGTPLMANNITLSSMGAPGDTNSQALYAKPAYGSVDHRYLIVWLGDDDANPTNTSQINIYGQFLDEDGNEVGNDDFVIYSAPSPGFLFAPLSLDLVYNSALNEFVVVFGGADDTGDREIFAQRVSGDGSAVGVPVRVSRMGPDGANADYFTVRMDVAFNPDLREYLIVWSGADDRFPLAPGEEEIFGQRLSEELTEVGEDDFRISDMGIDGVPTYDARSPQVVYNPTERNYLVTWVGDAFDPYLTDGEIEVYAQFLNEEGAQIGRNDVRISDIGPLGDPGYGNQTQLAPVAYNSARNEYVAVWSADESSTFINPQVVGEYEIFTQKLASHLCNDGIVELYEECDDGVDNSDMVPGACRTDCTLSEAEGTGEEVPGGTTGGDGGPTGTGEDTGEPSGDSGGGCSLVPVSR